MHQGRMDTTIDINNGENQVMAHVDVVNNYFGQTPGAPEPRPATMVAITGSADAQAIAEARHILLLGYRVDPRDTFFCDMLRANPSARITMVDSDMESSAQDLCRALQLNPNRYTPTRIQNHEARVYGNRVTIISAGLEEIDISEWVR